MYFRFRKANADHQTTRDPVLTSVWTIGSALKVLKQMFQLLTQLHNWDSCWFDFVNDFVHMWIIPIQGKTINKNVSFF